MGFCANCGRSIPEGYTYCQDCQNAASQQQAGQGGYQQQVYVQPNPYNPQYQLTNMMSECSTANTFGIIAIICSVVAGIALTIVFGAIGISKANNVINYATAANNAELLQNARSAKKLSIIAFVVLGVKAALSILIAVLTFVFQVSFFTQMFSV